MLRIAVPGREDLELEHLVLDYNGTLALDGALLPGVAPRLRLLAERLRVHVVTADTFGTAAARLDGLPLTLAVIGATAQTAAKRDYVQALGAGGCAAVGNGANDAAMLAAVALGICVTGPEGAAGAALQAATVVVPEIGAGLDLLLRPQRLVATLRQ